MESKVVRYQEFLFLQYKLKHGHHSAPPYRLAHDRRPRTSPRGAVRSSHAHIGGDESRPTVASGCGAPPVHAEYPRANPLPVHDQLEDAVPRMRHSVPTEVARLLSLCQRPTLVSCDGVAQRPAHDERRMEDSRATPPTGAVDHQGRCMHEHGCLPLLAPRGGDSTCPIGVCAPNTGMRECEMTAVPTSNRLTLLAKHGWNTTRYVAPPHGASVVDYMDAHSCTCRSHLGPRTDCPVGREKICV